MPHASRHTLRWLMPPSRRPSAWLAWRRAPGLLATLVGIDLRRPASWIAAAMGGWAGWWCCTRMEAEGVIAMLSAAVLVVAAIGDVPLTACVAAGRGLPILWACERAAWPLAGFVSGMLVAGGGPVSFGLLPVATVGALLAAVTTVATRLAGAKAADAASLTLLVAAASAAAGSGFASRLGGSFVGGPVAWLLLGGLGWAWARSQGAAVETLLPGTHRAGPGVGADVLHVDALPANGPMRQTLTRLAMVAALAAMAGWLMLEPAIDHASGGGDGQVGQAGRWDLLLQTHRAAVAWSLFTAALFIGLAVPQATLQDGIDGERGWERLFRTAANVRHGDEPRRFGIRSPRPGPVRFAGGVGLTQAAILGWPVLVCAVLSLPTPGAARLPLGIVIGLVAAAAVVSAIVWLGAAVHASRETAFAATLAMALVIVVWMLAIGTDSTLPPRQSARPSLPSLPSFLLPAAPVTSWPLTGECCVAGNRLILRNSAMRVEKSCPEAR